jgi:hypothetical protein
MRYRGLAGFESCFTPFDIPVACMSDSQLHGEAVELAGARGNYPAGLVPRDLILFRGLDVLYTGISAYERTSLQFN